MGNVHYAPSGASCQLSTSGMGGCQYGAAPPPRLSCSDHDESEVDAANAGGWVVEVYGSGSCQAHKPNSAVVAVEAAPRRETMAERVRAMADGLWAARPWA
jgi:hypothetical protein